MSKPMDLEKNHPDYNRRISWRRGMTAKTIDLRYGLKSDTIEMLASTGELLPTDTYGDCPECASRLKVKRIELGDPEKTKVYFLQCSASEDANHGFGKFSKHGVRAPMGRKPGGESKPEKPAPKPMPTPEIKTDKVLHPVVLKALKYIQAGERNLYFTGPAGTGKSTASEMLDTVLRGFDAWKDAHPFTMATLSQSTFTETLGGYLDRLNGGAYIETDLVKAMQKAGIVLIDEADKGNPNLAGFWNPILANWKIVTPGGTFNRHPDNVIIFVGNTTGHTPNKQYSGSVRQDFATLDRFRVFMVAFDEATERAAIPGLDNDLFGMVKKIRANAEKSGLQRIVGLRWLRRVNMTMKVEGMKPKNALLTVMKDECWSDDEILASGVNDLDKVEEKKAASVNKYY